MKSMLYSLLAVHEQNGGTFELTKNQRVETWGFESKELMDEFLLVKSDKNLWYDAIPEKFQVKVYHNALKVQVFTY